MALKDYLKHITRFVKKGADGPLYLVYFVTARCNARCGHCFYWKETKAAGEGTFPDELTLEEIEKISAGMDEILVLLISGGEPFIRKDLPEIIAIFYRNNHPRNIAIPTNGIMTKKICEDTLKILKNCPDAHLVINLSLDEIREAHDSTRGVHGCYEKAVETWKRLGEMKEEFPALNRGVILTMTALNQERIKDIYREVRDKLNPDSIALNLVRGKPADMKILDIDTKYYNELCTIMEEDLVSGRLPGYSGFSLSEIAAANNVLVREMVSRTVESGEFQLPCYAAELNGVIYPDGTLSACELLEQSLGNLREAGYGFKKLWKSQRADEIRKWIRETKCFCTSECNLTTNVLFNPFFAPEILSRAAALKLKRMRTKKD